MITHQISGHSELRVVAKIIKVYYRRDDRSRETLQPYNYKFDKQVQTRKNTYLLFFFTIEEATNKVQNVR